MSSDLEKLRISKDQKARRQHKPVWHWIVGALLFIGAGIALSQWIGAAPVIVQTMRVRVPDTTASEGQTVVLNATGYITAAHRVELASKVVGRVAWVGVEMGDKVKKNDVLVRLEDDEYEARVAQEQGQVDNAKARLAELEAGARPEEIGQAVAELDQMKADLHGAELTLNRLKNLDASRGASRQEIDDAEAVLQSRQAQVESKSQALALVRAGPRKEQIDAQRATVRQLEGALAQASLDLNNTVIRAPTDSTVLARNVEVGEFVTTGFVGDRGAKGYVVSIADLNDLRVELDISQNDFAKVSAKQPCWIVTDAYPDRKYDGMVDLISPEANRQKATVQVRVKVLKPDDLLKPDMNATVSFLSSGGNAATTRPSLRIPGGAVRDGAVFVVESGKAVRRTVTQGSKVGNEVDIQKGLIGGEDLIVVPPATLKDGDSVKIQENKS